MISLGIAGTAKNTGKTTTLQALLKNAQNSDLRCGISSIGYDGEWKDSITGLPKPRIHAHEGLLVAVASRCVAASTCEINIIMTTGIQTALGEILIGIVVKPGLLITAGPNKTSDLKYVMACLRKCGCTLFFLDGALNRIIPFALTDGIILATGAALSQDIGLLAEHTHHFAGVLGFPYKQCIIPDNYDRRNVQIVEKDLSSQRMQFNSLLTDRHANTVADRTTEMTEIIMIPGAIEANALSLLIEELVRMNKMPAILIASPLQLISGGKIELVHHFMNIWNEAGGSWCVEKKVPLLTITVNPYYPAYRFSRSAYADAYVNPDDLLETVRERVSVPVIDIRLNGSILLWNLILRSYSLK